MLNRIGIPISILGCFLLMAEGWAFPREGDLSAVAISPKNNYQILQKITNQSPFIAVELFLKSTKGRRVELRQIDIPDNISVCEAPLPSFEYYWSENENYVVMNVIWSNSEQQMICSIKSSHLSFTELASPSWNELLGLSEKSRDSDSESWRYRVSLDGIKFEGVQLIVKYDVTISEGGTVRFSFLYDLSKLNDARPKLLHREVLADPEKP